MKCTRCGSRGGFALLVLLTWTACVSAQQNSEDNPREVRPASSGTDYFLLKVGALYDQGDFGTPATSRVFFVPVTFRYVAPRFDVGVTPSFAWIDTPGGVRLVDGVPVPTGEGELVRQRFSGAGDTLLKSRLFLVEDKGSDSLAPALTPFVKVKIPTADANKNLGTGKADLGFGVEADKQVGSYLLFGDLGYTLVGKVAGFDLQNRPEVSFGVGKKMSPGITLSGLLDWRRALVRTTPDPAELVGILSYKPSRDVTLSPNVFVGLTKGSPAFGVGVELAVRFGVR